MGPRGLGVSVNRGPTCDLLTVMSVDLWSDIIAMDLSINVYNVGP